MKEIVSRMTASLISLLALALMTTLFTGCKNPADPSDTPDTGASVSDWAGLAAALTNPAIREITVSDGTGKITADKAVVTAGAKVITLPAYSALTLKGLTLTGNLTAAYRGRSSGAPPVFTIEGNVLIPAENTLLIKENVRCNINSAAMTVRGKLAFETGDSLPGGTWAIIGGSGTVSCSFDEEYEDFSAMGIPASGLLLKRLPGETLVAAPAERIISLSQESLILDAVAEGETPSLSTVRITNEGNIETGTLEVRADDRYLEFDGGDSAQIASIAGGNDALINFRIKSGLPAGIYQTTVTASGFSLQRRSFSVIFEVGASGVEGFSSVQALADHLASGTGTPSEPLNVSICLNLMYWPRLLELMAEAGDYVSLDLSDCTLPAESTAFNPDSSIITGKEYITSLTLPEAAESIAGGADGRPTFGGFARLEYLAARNVTGLGAYAFSGCSALKMVDLLALNWIGDYAFSGCSALKTVDLPVLTSIGAYVFSGCSALETVNLPVLNWIGDYAFSGCSSLETIALPALVNMTSPRSFYDGYGLTFPIMLDAPFLNCTSLRSISLPSVSLIFCDAFTGCTSLQSVTLGSTPPPLLNVEGLNTTTGWGPRQRKWLKGCAKAEKTITFYVPANSLPAYQSAWAGMITTTGILNSKTTITGTVNPGTSVERIETWTYVWDDDPATKDNLTVKLAAIPEV
jgi:hypothetical protein